ncbi:hypothetical protein A9264_08445 [Vibrio sp. UCD-FRSSP16_10]|uniref:O-antigen ligase family protein n=1 Tax=unclassified Vibrio TaxID=2614977 RepID=UPI0007FF7481|nr:MULTISPECIES: O-antigen ligase family protein [unclassified Vibrio]OBT06593.1 hypothetical protein A9260_09230 [Vibrio sp. UCD-FRSSP16_30]OBT12290.1 hypothetical protein A9264_08445 [Vibrio sp. UCD-FRSSP16_10]
MKKLANINLSRSNSINMLLCFVVFVSMFLNSDRLLSSFYVAFLQYLFILTVQWKESTKLTIKLSNLGYQTLFLALFVVSLTLSLGINLIFSSTQNELSVFSSFTRFIFILIHIMFGIACFKNFVSVGRFDAVFMSVVTATTLIAVACIFEYNFDAASVINNKSLSLPFAFNRRLTGFLVSFSCLYLIFKILTNYQRHQMKLALPSLLLMINFAFLIWLGGRSGYLTLIVVTVFYFSILIQKEDTSLRSLGVLIFILSAAIVMSIPLNVLEWNGLNRMLAISGKQSLNQLSSNRLEVWSDALSHVPDAIWLGHGPDAYKFLGGLGYFQPHNVFIQLLVEVGLIGTLFISLFFTISTVSPLFNIFKIPKKQRKNTVLCIGIFGGFVVQGMLDGTFYWASTLMLIILSLSALKAVNTLGHSSQATT